MKKSLLLLILFLPAILLAQGPTDYVKYYSFDNGSIINEASPGTGDLIASNTTYTFTTGAEGAAGSALKTNTAVLDAGNFPSISQEYTYSFWAKRQAGGSSIQTMVTRFDNNNGTASTVGGGVEFWQFSSGVAGQVRQGTCPTCTDAFTTASNTTTPLNTWQHLAYVISESTDSNGFIRYTIDMYVDGNLEDSDITQGLGASQNPGTTNINTSVILNNSANFLGEIDELKIYQRALTALEVNDLATISSLPSDAVRSYSFTNGSLINIGNMAGGDLTSSGTSFTSVADFDGNANNALDMNGDVFDGGITPITSQNSSYSFWLKVEPATNAARILNHFGSNGGNVDIYVQGTNLIGRLEDSGGNSRALFINNINDGLWHHITLTIEQVTVNNVNGYEGKFYLDGTLIDTDITNGPNNSVNPNWITFYSNPSFGLNDGISNAQFYQDAIDEVKVFDRVLTTAEITALATNNSNPPLTQVFVDADATGNNDGTSWNDAFTSLQTALQLNPGAEFWVADGTYKPGTQRSDTFDLNTDNTIIYGGFDGTETMLSQRDPETNITILSGDIDSDDASVSYNDITRNDNSFQVVTVNATDCIIDGVTITSGHADGSSNDLKEGAAISVNDGNFTLTHSRVEKCVTTRGGSIRAIDQQGTMNIENTIFSENLGNIGPILYARAGNANFFINMTNCVFENNTKESIGTANGIGLVWIRQDGGGVISYSLINSTVVNNEVDNSNTNTPLLTISQITSGNRAANAYVHNSIFHNNRNITSGGSAMMLALGNGTSQNDASLLVAQYSISEMGFVNIFNDGITGVNTNNSTADPLFTSSTDYTLQTSSPARDNGNNSLFTSSLTTDVAGNTRIVNNTIDRGAYEFGATAGIEESNKLEFVLYPNPASNVLHVSGDLDFAKAEIYNLQGQQVAISKEPTIQVADLRAGMYLIKVTDEDGAIATQQFIKK
ncbi:putative secreted protein (Por secretion system target) [Nonlabens dokdonensis]|uniref:Fibronectin type III domain protein n=2 Tax=Nonlabens dokdonensis TaxID=328515 RepID=L7W6U9_NONDD|nr:LamG-like jellyroll fold domain-containing protein [Nonlabens dokdonensis]AGC75521.1 fibronectin type III domain protein [Nonlabens dokdonensis DSW-6]PZX43217.1 putative secreted protein (Por secretion system target) [Nonlabens dokdonensis]